MRSSGSTKIVDKRIPLVQLIRESPVNYLCEKSLTRLAAFIGGYALADFENGAERPIGLPRDFDDWVLYRLHDNRYAAGYWDMILEHVPNEETAFDRFYELLDEHHRRIEKVVALIDCPRESQRRSVTTKWPNGEVETTNQTYFYPQDLRIVTYTDDPGFFLAHDSDCPAIERRRFVWRLRGSFMSLYQPPQFNIKITDQFVWQRLLREEADFQGHSS